MALMLKRQRNGMLRDCWYGVYTEANGVRKVVNLNIKVDGTPPESGLVGDAGDDKFEKSRKNAYTKLAEYKDEAGRKGRADHLTERLIEAKTGRSVEYVKIEDLNRLWRTLGRELPAGDRHLMNCEVRFNRFVEFMRERNPETVFLYEVKPADTTAFVEKLHKVFARSTARSTIHMLNRAFARFLPVGAMNPFAAFLGHRSKGGVGNVHRRPFTDKELRALIDTARGDPFMYPLIVTAACTGMRRADVCGLQWSSVDLAEGMLAVKTGKTGAEVEIPILSPLRAVLTDLQGNQSPYVFPEAAAMMRDNPQGLSYRLKMILARALGGKSVPALPAERPTAEIAAEGAAAIAAKIKGATRRKRALDTFRRYCEGQSLRAIAKATGRQKSAISCDLHLVETMIGKSFVRKGQVAGIKDAVARLTRTARKDGQRDASLLDWHALRTTFVTMALSAGVPMELVRRVTGHATVEIVLKNYFRPGREQFKSTLFAAMPAVLTGGTVTPVQMTPTEELKALTEKVVVGTATKADKARLRKVAARV